MKSAHSRGFTLLEIVVVIAIFAIMSLMAYGGLGSVLKARRQVENSLERTAQFQKAYQRLRNDLQQVRNRPARDGYGDTQPPMRGDRDTHLEFTRGGWANPLQQPRASLERISYRLTEKKLVRDSWRVLDQAQDSKVVTLELLDNVDELHLRYLSANREWVESWPPATNTGSQAVQSAARAPLAVEITLQSKDWKAVKFLFRLGMDVPPSTFVPGSAAGSSSANPATKPNPPPPANTEPQQ